MAAHGPISSAPHCSRVKLPDPAPLRRPLRLCALVGTASAAKKPPHDANSTTSTPTILRANLAKSYLNVRTSLEVLPRASPHRPTPRKTQAAVMEETKALNDIGQDQDHRRPRQNRRLHRQSGKKPSTSKPPTSGSQASSNRSSCDAALEAARTRPRQGRSPNSSEACVKDRSQPACRPPPSSSDEAAKRANPRKPTPTPAPADLIADVRAILASAQRVQPPL